MKKIKIIESFWEMKKIFHLGWACQKFFIQILLPQVDIAIPCNKTYIRTVLSYVGCLGSLLSFCLNQTRQDEVMMMMTQKGTACSMLTWHSANWLCNTAANMLWIYMQISTSISWFWRSYNQLKGPMLSPLITWSSSCTFSNFHCKLMLYENDCCECSEESKGENNLQMYM